MLSPISMVAVVNNRGPVTLCSLHSNWVMEAGLKYQACCCVTCWCGCRCRQPPSCRAPLVLPLVWGPWCGGGEQWRVTENRKWKIPVWSAVVVDQVWTAERRSEQEGADGADSCCSPTSSLSTTAHQLRLGPSARYWGLQVSPDQPGQPCWVGGRASQGKKGRRKGGELQRFTSI